MKLMYFNDYKLGVIKDDTVVDVSAVVQNIAHTGPHDLISGLIEHFAEYRPRLEEAAARGKGVPLAEVKVRPPLPKPVNIDCMAVNYMEDGTRTEPAPINAFHKSPNAVIGPEDTMVLPDVPATIFEGEAEVAAVIGKRAKDVKAADAMSHIFGYVNFIDGSARGLPPPGNVFYQMKSRDTRRWAPTSSRPMKSAIRISFRCGSGSTACSSRISTPATWPTRSRAASSGSAPSTRSSPAMCWRPAPITAA